MGSHEANKTKVKERIDKCPLNDKGIKIVQWTMPTPKVQFQPRYLTTIYIRDSKFQAHRYRKSDLPFFLPGKVPRRRKVSKKKREKAIKSAEVVIDVDSDSEVEVDNNKVTNTSVISEDSSSEVETLEVIASDDGLFE